MSPNPRIREIRTWHPIGPWHAKVSVIATDVHRGRYSITPSDILYTIEAEWTGPPAHGARPSDIPVQAAASATAPNLTTAMHIAYDAVLDLRAGHVPDLRWLARTHAPPFIA